MLKLDRFFYRGLGFGLFIGLGLLGLLLSLQFNLFKSDLSVANLSPHGYCLLWQPGLVWVYATTDTLIGLAYVSISTTLVFIYTKIRHNIPFQWVIVAFGIFIISCGGTHFMDVWTLWSADYWWAGAVRIVTALASIFTAISLLPLTPQILKVIRAAKASQEHKQKLEIAYSELKIEIAERKQVEQALRQSEARFSKIFHSIPMPVILIRMEDNVCLDINSHFTALTEFNREELLGHNLLDLIDLNLDNQTSITRELVNNNYINDLEVEIHTKRAESRWVIISAELLETDGEKCSLITLYDITERKQAALALQQSEQRFQLLVEGVQDYAIYLLDPNGRVSSWNKGAERIKGYQAEEILGVHFSRFFEEEAVRQGKPERVLQIAATQGRYADEDWRVRKDGSRFWASVLINALRDKDGHIVGFSKISRDMTQYKLTQEILRRSEESYRTLVRNIPGIAVFLFDQELRLMLAEGNTLPVFGYSKEYLEGKTLQTITHLEGFQKIEAFSLEALTGVSNNYEFSWDEHNYSLQTLPVMNAGGRIFAGLLVIQDITLHKQIEQKLRNFTVQLEHSNRELQDFAVVASHDLQEPLRKIIVFGDRLKTESSGSLSPQGRDYLERLQNATYRMQTLISDLLTFSRVSTKPSSFTLIKLNKLVCDVVSDLEIQDGGQIEIGELPVIEGDTTQFRQLFQNLISNALKFHVASKPPLVRISAQHLAEEGFWQILVEDNGIGFDEKYLDRIFTIFQRLHGRGEYEGTGIGLAVCRKIVERHGGNITARSQPGLGATFIIELPLTLSKGKLNE